MADFFYYLTMILFCIVCVMLILLILIQKGRGGGLSSAFGGVGGHTAFGSKTGDVLTWATAIFFGVFLLLAIFANVSFNAVNASVARPGTTTTPAPPPVPKTTPGTPAPIAPDPGVRNPPAGVPAKNAPPADAKISAPPTSKP